MRLGPRLAALAALCGFVLLAHVVNPAGGVPLRLHGILDVAHVLGFAGFAWVVAGQAWRFAEARRRSGPVAFAIAIAFTVLLAGVSEAVQAVVGREPSFADLLRDAGGIAAGAIFCLVAARRLRPAWVGAAFAVLAIMLWEPGRIVAAVTASKLRMPVLAAFESPLEDVLYNAINATVARLPADSGWPSPGHVAVIRPVAGERYAGIGFLRLPPDWTGYASLSFVIAANDPGPRSFSIRIHDIRHDFRYEDRYNGSFDMGSEPRTVTIPLEAIRKAPAGRELDIGRIEHVVVFVDTTIAGGGFRIDDLRLE